MGSACLKHVSSVLHSVPLNSQTVSALLISTTPSRISDSVLDMFVLDFKKQRHKF